MIVTFLKFVIPVRVGHCDYSFRAPKSYLCHWHRCKSRKIHAFFCEKKNLNERIDCKYVDINSRIINGIEKKNDVYGLDTNGSEYEKERSVTIMTMNRRCYQHADKLSKGSMILLKKCSNINAWNYVTGLGLNRQ